jgi:parvulin-like peptidyl-prolyl isomerase
MKTISRLQTMFMVMVVLIVMAVFITPGVASESKSTPAAEKPAKKAPAPAAKKPAKKAPAPAAKNSISKETVPAAAPESKPTPTAEKPDAKESAAAAEMFVPFNVPLFSPRFADFPVATVEDDPITLKELTQALAASHEERMEGKAANKEHSSGKKKYLAMVNRLIMLRLITHEARNMGMDELPDVKETMDAYSKQYLIDRVEENALANVKPDDAEVEALYQEIAKEFKMKSALFEKDWAAKTAFDDITGGRDFDETIKRYLESHEARVAAELEDKYLKRDGLLPAIAQAVTDMKVGAVTPPIPIERGWVILKLIDARPPQQEDPAARQEARKQSLDHQRGKALTEFKKGILKKYATLNLKLYNKLDYESKDANFDKLRKDDRVIAKIEGEKPLTVGEFTEAIEAKLYHGVKAAQESKSINEKKPVVLNEILGKRLELKEALQTGIDKTDEYKDSMKRYEEAVLFNRFIQKIIVPDLKVGEEDQRAYYESHKKEFTRQPMVKLKSLAFKVKKDADSAIARLRKGVDFNWMKANAGGVVTDAEELPAANVPMIVSSLPEGLQKEIEGSKEGDIRLYVAPPKGLFYVVLVATVVPEDVQPFEVVSKQIRTKIINEQITKSLEEWSAKLRDAYTVTVYLSETEK